MPELPEVEITRRGLEREWVGRRIDRLIVRETRLRWPVLAHIPNTVSGQKVHSLRRRAKYLLVYCDSGQLLLHLGMSGSLRVMSAGSPATKHDHIDFLLDNGKLVRFTDPRRFGSLHWLTGAPDQHPLLANLGVEPLSGDFTSEWLYRETRGSKVPIKQFLMDARRVVGIGNIYANEALFRARIHPSSRAGRIGAERAKALVAAIKRTLRLALKAGGSSLRDFVHSDGGLGCFQMQYRVYGRTGAACFRCGAAIRLRRQGQRSTFYCAGCQR